MKVYLLLLVFILLNIVVSSATIEKDTFFKNINEHVQKAESEVNVIQVQFYGL